MSSIQKSSHDAQRAQSRWLFGAIVAVFIAVSIALMMLIDYYGEKVSSPSGGYPPAEAAQ